MCFSFAIDIWFDNKIILMLGYYLPKRPRTPNEMQATPSTQNENNWGSENIKEMNKLS